MANRRDNACQDVSMNLSCGKCRCVRPFSGDPPKCDICGWRCCPNAPDVVADAAKLQTKSHTKYETTIDTVAERLRHVIVFGFWIFILIGVAVSLYKEFRPEKETLAEKYHVSTKHVVVEPKPHGCDFSDAPLGDKHCHFKEVIYTVNECESPSCRVENVTASWEKVSE
jgi:hypothetical protein